MSKNTGSSSRRKSLRLHVDPFQGRKFRQKRNKAGKYRQQVVLITDKNGNVLSKRTISHRKDGNRLINI